MPLVTERTTLPHESGAAGALMTVHYVRCRQCRAAAEPYHEVDMDSEWGRGMARARAESAGWRWRSFGRLTDWLCPTCAAAPTPTPERAAAPEVGP